ncbi:GPI mannosyltransferase 2-like [Physella acuta]|uniref:GPI mannosyltransferase 2-like n=1 Tax=Physella acuta TaxID=109671 RepID=UPI0027DD24E2|nr:GPI mannosyltransferase 2-like [Physella acuta]
MEFFKDRIIIFASSSRLLILILQVVANSLLPDHDAGVFSPPTDKNSFTWLDHMVHFFFGGLHRWDAVYFTHIMQYGYSYENCAAFFPCFPIVVSTLARILSTLGILHLSSWLLVTGVVLNYFVFVATVFLLFQLGKSILRDEEVSYYACLFFCINPASIFMSAIYSETLFAFFNILAMLELHRKRIYWASLYFGLAVFTRSNGIVSIGFVLHTVIKSLLNDLYFNHKTSHRERKLNQAFNYLLLLKKTAVELGISLSICFLPFCLYQYYIYRQFCLQSDKLNFLPTYIVDYGRDQGYKLIGDQPSPWCNATLPLSYSYIQKHHWNVGFLSYYELKQLPNFMLALPIIILSVRSCLYFFGLNKKLFYGLGFCDKVEGDQSVSRPGEVINEDCVNTTVYTRVKDKQKMARDSHSDIKVSSEIVVLVFHLASLLLFGCFFMHIQVLTRLLCSSSPLLYWYVSVLYLGTSGHRTTEGTSVNCDSNIHQNKTGFNLPRAIVYILRAFKLNFIIIVFNKWHSSLLEFKCYYIYFLTYCVVGTVMFSNFLPWT